MGRETRDWIWVELEGKVGYSEDTLYEFLLKNNKIHYF